MKQLTSNPDIVCVIHKSDTEDYTLLNSEQAAWNVDNLLSIIYNIQPLDMYPPGAVPVFKAPFLIYGKQVNDFRVLPWQISSQVEGWRLETWCRLDRRISADDIIDRVHPDYRHKISPAMIQSRRRFFREHFNVMAWGPRAEDKLSNENNIRIRNLIKRHRIDLLSNSTRGLTPGLILPPLGETGGRVPLPSKHILRYIESPGTYAVVSFGALPYGDTGAYYCSVGDVRFIGDLRGNWWWQQVPYYMVPDHHNIAALLPVYPSPPQLATSASQIDTSTVHRNDPAFPALSPDSAPDSNNGIPRFLPCGHLEPVSRGQPGSSSSTRGAAPNCTCGEEQSYETCKRSFFL